MFPCFGIESRVPLHGGGAAASHLVCVDVVPTRVEQLLVMVFSHMEPPVGWRPCGVILLLLCVSANAAHVDQADVNSSWPSEHTLLVSFGCDAVAAVQECPHLDVHPERAHSSQQQCLQFAISCASGYGPAAAYRTTATPSLSNSLA